MLKTFASQSSYKLVNSILSNYQPLIAHLETLDTNEAKGLLSKWTREDTVTLAACVCDTLYIYKRFQKRIQSDDLTIFDLESARDHCVEQIEKLLQRPLPGGYEEKICRSTSEDETKSATFLDTVLSERVARRGKSANVFVTSGHRDVGAVKNELIRSLVEFLKCRLHIDKATDGTSYAVRLKAVSPSCLKAGNAEEIDVKGVFDTIVPDLDWRDFRASYFEVVTALKKSPATTLSEILVFPLANKHWKTVSTALARVLVSKPHSCDVERLVSAYNIVKDDDRCSLASNTVDAYLHIHVNMPPLSSFDVRPSLHAWMLKGEKRPHPTSKAMEQEWFSGVFY